MGILVEVAAQQTQHARRVIRVLTSFHFLTLGKTGACRFYTRILALLFFGGCVVSIFPVAYAEDVSSTDPPLIEKYHQLKEELDNNIFGSPILIQSKTGDNYVKGEVYAVLDEPIEALDTLLSKPASWCELGILHVNVKACVYSEDQVQYFVGRKYYQTPSQANPVLYQFEQLPGENQHLNVKLTAPGGPFGTTDYLVRLKAVPLDESHSFIHYQYSYQFGFFADLAMGTYLATMGRHKVGFTITGTDPSGEPEYVKGQQGIIERNIMRYIFAIQSLLETRTVPAEERQKAQLNHWFDHISRFPKQLVEITREKYLSNKKSEIENQRLLQGQGIKPQDLASDVMPGR